MQHTNKAHSLLFAQQLLEAHLNQPEEDRIKLFGIGAETLEALFLGTRGSNAKYMQELMGYAVLGNVNYRKSYFPSTVKHTI